MSNKRTLNEELAVKTQAVALAMWHTARECALFLYHAYLSLVPFLALALLAGLALDWAWSPRIAVKVVGWGAFFVIGAISLFAVFAWITSKSAELRDSDVVRVAAVIIGAHIVIAGTLIYVMASKTGFQSPVLGGLRSALEANVAPAFGALSDRSVLSNHGIWARVGNNYGTNEARQVHLSVEQMQLTDEHTIVQINCSTWDSTAQGVLLNAKGAYILDNRRRRYPLLEDHGEYRSSLMDSEPPQRVIAAGESYPFKLVFPRIPDKTPEITVWHPTTGPWTVQLSWPIDATTAP